MKYSKIHIIFLITFFLVSTIINAQEQTEELNLMPVPAKTILMHGKSDWIHHSQFLY